MALWFSALGGGCGGEVARTLCEPGVRCEGITELRCALGDEGRLYGRDRVEGERCVPSEAGCREAEVTCGHWGQCGVGELREIDPGACPAGTREGRDFRASREVRCLGGGCVAQSDAQCEQAAVCRLEGRCRAEGGICVADAQGCRASEYCRQVGACTAKRGQCVAGGDGDCRQSAICLDFGRCHFRRGRCLGG